MLTVIEQRLRFCHFPKVMQVVSDLNLEIMALKLILFSCKLYSISLYKAV